MTQELPAIVKDMFHVSNRREDTFICGLSMGGYGTLRMAMLNPDNYAGAACMSAGNFVETLVEQAKNNNNEGWRAGMINIFGERFPDLLGTEYDVYHIVKEQLAAGKTLPKVLFCCGTEDHAYGNAVNTYEFFKSQDGVDLTQIHNRAVSFYPANQACES